MSPRDHFCVVVVVAGICCVYILILKPGAWHWYYTPPRSPQCSSHCMRRQQDKIKIKNKYTECKFCTHILCIYASTYVYNL